MLLWYVRVSYSRLRSIAEQLTWVDASLEPKEEKKKEKAITVIKCEETN